MMGGKGHDDEDYGKGKGKGEYETEDVSVIVSDFTVGLFLIESLLHIHFVFSHTFCILAYCEYLILCSTTMTVTVKGKARVE
jgi:hypothetical protein